MARLLAIDGLNIVRRMYEASPEPDSADKALTALRYAQSSLHKLLRQHAPTHVLLAFDAGGATWRHALYAGYRAGRVPMPEVLKSALAPWQAQLQAQGWPLLAIEGVEADDVLATAVQRWLAEGRGEAYVASTDKDLHSLIAQGALLWDPFKGVWHDAAWVEAKWGVAPAQLADLLALMGDPADSIPGVSGVGVKTAARLLRTYGTLEGILAGAGILQDRLGVTLRKEKEMLYLSRQLVELKTDVRLGVSWNMLAWSGPSGA